MDMLNNLIETITSYLQTFGVPFGIMLIILESILPVLPLGVFVAFNVHAFGNIIGFGISWIATIVGCILSYFVFGKLFATRIMNRAKDNDKLNKVITTIKKISFPNLVLIIALPFTPAFLVNIAAGITNVKFKKFFVALLIGKISIVYFWGFIGKSLLESVTDIDTIIIVTFLLLASLIISKLVNKKFKIE